MSQTLTELLRAPPGRINLGELDSAAKPGCDKEKDDGPQLMEEIGQRLAEDQERLFASGRSETDERRLLLVLQGMDTSGKGGVVRKAVGLVDPQGVSITSFKKPTKEELAHDFLWHIEKALPEPGMMGIFDRSHYEDVLIGRVRKLADDAEIERRYGAINDWEEKLADSGVTIVKCFLHISSDDQKERLQERLDNPEKHWKYNPGDIDERMLWDEYQKAYEIAIERCNSEKAPWFIVPSGRKWYRNWAVATLLAEHLEAMNLEWPEADFDVEAEKKRLAAT
ncbi:MAG: PPK2 family polyphosphate kinase [Gammaproteobacteria bacterium]